MDQIVAIAGFSLLFLAGVVIIVRAFKFDVAWGLAVLLIPLAQFVYMSRHWEESPKANAVFIFSLVVLIFVFIPYYDKNNQGNYGSEYSSEYESEYESRYGSEYDSDNVTAETINVEPVIGISALAKAERTRESYQSSKYWVQQAIIENKMQESPVSNNTRQHKSKPKKVSPKLAGKYLGHPATIIMKDEKIRYGTIKSIQLDSITIEKTYFTGELTYDLAVADIKALEVNQ